MATLRAFAALRPSPQSAARVSAVPYDVVSSEEARRLAAGNPLSFLHVSRPEIDLPEGSDPHSEAAYRKAAENLEALKRDAPLMAEAEPSLYVYRLRMGDHEQTGVAACCSLDEYDSDIVRKHERTRPEKEDDRTRHMIALSAQTGPVFLTYRDLASAGAFVEDAKRGAPLYDFEADDGIRHTLWRMPPRAAQGLIETFARVPLLYIADGHHRAASASRARKHLRGTSPAGRQATEELDFFLAVVFPASQVRILPYNRVVRDTNGRSPEDLLAELRKEFSVTEGAPPTPSRRGEIAMYLGGRWFGLSGDGGRPVRVVTAADALDVTVLQERVLAPLLGIHDVRTDKRIDFVGGIRGVAELERLVDSGAAAVAFSLFPVSLTDLMAISDENQIMPPKSTWFEPKLRDGLLIHRI
jgi:uncharacterized protein (DUF1015 family)